MNWVQIFASGRAVFIDGLFCALFHIRSVSPSYKSRLAEPAYKNSSVTLTKVSASILLSFLIGGINTFSVTTARAPHRVTGLRNTTLKLNCLHKFTNDIFCDILVIPLVAGVMTDAAGGLVGRYLCPGAG